MATLLCFHAHPDDEAIATSGLMMQGVAEGHRVVLVVATRGEMGLEPEDGLADGETLADRRTAETFAAAEIMGVHRVEFLGYYDSDMAGEPGNDNPECFWQADVDEAAARLADLVADEDIDIMTIYDDHGGYDHPDHIQVHKVGTRFAEQAGIDKLYWATMNRTAIEKMTAESAELEAELAESDDEEAVDRSTFGMAEEDITYGVDATPYIDRKRAAMVAHASQISEDSFFLKMPPEIFEVAFGTEWFHAPGQPGPPKLNADLFAI